MTTLSLKLILLTLITIHFFTFDADDNCEPSGYCVDPTTDVTCGLTQSCTILCVSMGACKDRVFTFLNDWGQTKDHYKATLTCTAYGTCDNIVIIANTSLLSLNFEGEEQGSMEAYINFGSYHQEPQYTHISCNGSYSCHMASLVFNSMIETDTGSKENDPIPSNGIVMLNCTDDGSCSQMVITAFQAYDLNVNCNAAQSCHALTIYSPIKPHLDYYDTNTNLNCHALASNGSYDGACKNIKIYNYAGKHLAHVTCSDNECGVELFCGFMYEHSCDYFNCTEKHCNASIGEYVIQPLENQFVVSPNKLVMDYRSDIFEEKEIYIYVSTLYEKFIYFYSKGSNLFNATYPRIYCPINGICNIICTDVGHGAHYDHCAYGIFYGNESLEMNVRGYEADNSKWYGSIHSFYWNGMQGNENVELYLQSTEGEVLFDCNGTTDLYSYSNLQQNGCNNFKIYLGSPELFEMNCWKTSSCPSTQIYTALGSYKHFPDEFLLKCNKSDHTSCREMDIHLGDRSGCEYSITGTNLTYFYWDCIKWYTGSPTMLPTHSPTTVLEKESNNGWVAPLIVVIGLLLLAVIVFLLLKKFGKPQLSSFMSSKRRSGNEARAQSFVGLDDISSSN